MYLQPNVELYLLITILFAQESSVFVIITSIQATCVLTKTVLNFKVGIFLYDNGKYVGIENYLEYLPKSANG